MQRPLFIIPPVLVDALSTEETDATFSAMREFGLDQEPFLGFDIVSPGLFGHLAAEDGKSLPAAFSPPNHWSFGEDSSSPFTDYCARKGVYKYKHLLSKDVQKEVDENLDKLLDAYSAVGEMLRRILLVLLKTPNCDQEYHALGERAKRYGLPKTNYSCVTYLRIGRVTKTVDAGAPRGPVRPHLRRGHIRRQHYGERNSQVKEVFIAPLFVHADAGWIAARTAYKFTLGELR